jgi:hypothetical protein
MTVRRALAAALVDLYHQAWRMLLLNVLLGAVLLAIVLATIATPLGVLLGFALGPLTAAVMHCAVTLAQTEELRLAEVGRGLYRHWRRGLALGVLLVVVAVVGTLAMRFYTHAGTWAWPFAALCVYVLVAAAAFQMALWPLAVFETERSLRIVARDAAFVVFRRPLGFVGLALALLLVNIAGVAAAILPFLTLTIAYSFLAVAHYALPANPAREA